MSRFKKILILLVVVLSIGFIFYVSRLGSGQRIQVIPNPKIPNYLKSKYELKLNVEEKDFSFPTNVPLLNVNQNTPLSKDEAVKSAQNLGFEGEPKIATDSREGTTYVWTNINGALFVYSKSRRLEYSINTLNKTVNKQLSEESIKTTAKEFIVNNFNIDPNSIDFSFFTFYNVNTSIADELRTTSKQNANVYQVNFSPKIAGFHIITLDPKTSPINVWVLPDGSIAKATAIKYTDLTESNTKYQIKSYQELVANLRNAIVVSLDDGNVQLQDLPENAVKEIIINKTELYYLESPTASTFLQPVYVLKGKALITGFESEVNAFLYLQAVKN